MKKLKILFFLCLTLLSVSGPINAARAVTLPVIVVGNNALQPNQAGQFISIYVSGGQAVQGVNFNVKIGDGGTLTGGTDTGPTLQNVDLTSGIFAPNNTGQSNGTSPLLWNSVVTTSSGFVNADGLLAILTVSTVGIPAGTIKSLSLTPDPIFGGNTDFAGLSANITNGTISVVPEPSSISLMIVGGIMCGSLLYRKRSLRLNGLVRDGKMVSPRQSDSISILR